jgi:hypothetical protein
MPALKLGDFSGDTTASRFVILPGSFLTSSSGPTVLFDKTNNCIVNLALGAVGGGGNLVSFGEGSNSDTLRIPALSNILATDVHVSADDPSIELNGYFTPPSFADVDPTPSILMGKVFLSGVATETITDFTHKASGKEFTVISKAAITYDTTGTNLVGSTTDIVTESGDVTKWICEDDTTVRLISWTDVSQDNSSNATGLYGQ